jgi:tRNA-splicing ligase RtcB
MDRESSFEIIHEKGGAPIKAWIRGVQLEAQARQQLLNVARLPFIYHHVAVMPDVHWGMGATIGSVIPTIGAIVPAAIGVDLGCGMAAVRSNLRADQLPDSLAGVRSAIEAAVPHGRTNNGRPSDKGAWDDLPKAVASAWEHLDARFRAIVEKHPKVGRANTVGHLGTLGTGNHFIEVCLEDGAPSDRNFVWVMLHSGSRGIGNRTPF